MRSLLKICIWTILALVVLVAGGSLLALTWLRDDVVDILAKEAGLPGLTIDSLSLSPDGIVLVDLVPVPGANHRIGNIEALGTIDEILEGRIEAIRLTDPVIELTIDETGAVTVPGLYAPSGDGDADASPPTIPALPFQWLVIENGRLQISQSPAGPVTIDLDGRLTIADEGLVFDGTVDGLQEFGSLATAVTARWSPESLSVGLSDISGLVDHPMGAGMLTGGWVDLSMNDGPPIVSGSLTASVAQVLDWPGGDVGLTLSGTPNAVTVLVDGQSLSWASVVGLDASVDLSDSDHVTIDRADFWIESTAVETILEQVGLDLPLSGAIVLDGRAAIDAPIRVESLADVTIEGSLGLAAQDVAFTNDVSEASLNGAFSVTLRDGVGTVTATSPLLVTVLPSAALGLDDAIGPDRSISVAVEPGFQGRRDMIEGDTALTGGGTVRIGPHSLAIDAASVTVAPDVATWMADLAAVDLVVAETSGVPVSMTGEIGTVSLKGEGDSIAATATGVEFAGPLAFGDTRIDGFAVSGDFDIRVDGDNAAVRPHSCLTLAADRIQTSDISVRLREALCIRARGDDPLISRTVSVDGEEQVQVSGDIAALRAGIDLAGGPSIQISAPGFSVDATADGAGTLAKASIRGRGGRVLVPVEHVDLSNFAISASLDTTRSSPLQVDLDTRFTHRHTPAYVAPLAVSVSASGDPSATLRYTGRAEDDTGLLSLRLDGRHNIASGRGALEATLAPIILVAGEGTQIFDLFPISNAYVVSVGGVVDGQISLAYGGSGGPTGNATLGLDDVDVATALVEVQGLRGVLQSDRILDGILPPGQLLEMDVLNVGLPLEQGQLALGYDPSKGIEVDSAGWSWADGIVGAEPFVIDPVNPNATIVLIARGLDFGSILSLIAVNGLTATGRLDGRLPMVVTLAGVSIQDGVLEANGPGKLQYVPDPVITDANPDLALPLQIAENFEYETLRVTVSGELGREQDITLFLVGKNPDVYEGHPAELTLNVSGALDSLVAKGAERFAVPPELLQQYIQEYGVPSQ